MVNIPLLNRPVQAHRSEIDRQPLRIASLNVWGLRWPFARDIAARMDAIALALPGLEADVITFQEVWTREVATVLREAGTRAGLIHQFDAQALTGGSGLLVLSRHPISQSRFERYLMGGLPERIRHADYWGGKGYTQLEISSRAGPIALINTHLHAQYAEAAYPSYRSHRMGQVVQLAFGLSRISAPVVAAGDFNMREAWPEYRAFTGLTGMRDCAAEREHRQPTNLDSNPYHAGRSEGDSRIDYVFAKDGVESSIDVISSKRIFDSDLEIDGHRASYSDHAGLLVDVAIRNQPGASHTPNPAAVELARKGLATGRGLAEQRQRRERWEALAGIGVGGLAIASRRSAPLARRKFLRALLGGVAAVGVGSALGFAALSEFTVRQELENYQEVERQLDDLAARSLSQRT